MNSTGPHSPLRQRGRLPGARNEPRVSKGIRPRLDPFALPRHRLRNQDLVVDLPGPTSQSIERPPDTARSGNRIPQMDRREGEGANRESPQTRQPREVVMRFRQERKAGAQASPTAIE